MRDFLFDNHVRLDWGFGNPNVTGSLIALLMVAVWVTVWWSRWGFWIALIANSTLGVFLVQTFSRGALVAAIAGLATVVCLARPWRRLHVVASTGMVIGLAVYSYHLGATERYTKGIAGTDASLGNRWLIYKTVPRMMWDAPEGWGVGRSGEAFMQWYQPLGRLETYRHLVNSHATWLTEWGWLGRLGYVSGWVAIFHLFWSCGDRGRGIPAVASAVWITFGTAAAFNTIYHRWMLWCVPLLFLVAVLGWRIYTRTFPHWKYTLGFAAAGSCVFVLVTGGWAALTTLPHTVMMTSGFVQLGDGREGGKAMSVVAVDSKVLGQFYGHRAREVLELKESEHWSSIAIAWFPGSKPPVRGRCVIVAGDKAATLFSDISVHLVEADRIVVLNPGVAPPSLADSALSVPVIEVWFGDRFKGPSRYSWEILADKDPRIKIGSIPMTATFVSKWAQKVDESLKGE